MNRKLFILSIFAFLLLWSSAFGQNNPILGTTVVCPNTNCLFYIDPSSLNRAPIPRIDDRYADNLTALGFPFKFYGNYYDSCLLSTNFYLLLGTSDSLQPLVGKFSPFQVAPLVTSPLIPYNAIFGAWQDTDPGANPTIGFAAYSTIGASPNREFIYDFCDMPLFRDNTKRFTGQIKLKETSNQIEFHIAQKDTTFWYPTVQGILDSTGNNFITTPGRNGTYWQAYNDAYALIPLNSACTSYYSAPITYNPTQVGNGTFEWTFANTIIGYGDSIAFTPTQSGYLYARRIGCTSPGLDSVFVFVDQFPNLSFATSSPKMCKGETFLISHSGSNYQHFSVDWGNGTFDTTFRLQYSKQFLVPGSYLINIDYQTPRGCPKNFNIRTYLTDTPSIAISSKSPYCFLDPVLLNVQSNADSVYVNWADGSINLYKHPSSYTHQYAAANTYQISANALINTYGYGCFNQASVKIDAIKMDPSTKLSLENTTNTNQGILLYWKDYPKKTNFNIYRQDFTGVYQKINSTTDTFWIDQSASNLQVNRYKVTVIDSCQNESQLSNSGNNIVLQGVVNSQNQADLIWNMYRDFPDNIKSYALIRLDTVINLQKVFSTNYDTTYLDKTLDQSLTAGVLYQAIAISTNGKISASNRILLNPLINIFIPNAFTPNDDGHNDIWKPVFNDSIQFDFDIYNRWGERILSGNELNCSWDGTFHGIDCPGGQYVLRLRYRYPNRKQGLLKQTITLIR